MGRYAALLAAILSLTVPAAALASPYNRNCGTSRDGWLVGQSDPSHNDETPFEVNGPWHIRMTRGEAVRLVKRFPIQEFGTRITLAQTPCLVGGAIAQSASQAWSDWADNDGWANVTAYTSGGAAYIGRFYCSGYSADDGAAVKETCTMHRHGGRIVGSFVISSNPYY